MSKVFKASSDRFFPAHHHYAVRVIMAASSLTESEVQKLNKFEKDIGDVFVKTFEIIRL
jgi:hypothetical protein